MHHLRFSISSSSPRDSISVHRHIWGWKLSNCQNWLVKRQEKNGEISCIKAKLCMMTAKQVDCSGTPMIMLCCSMTTSREIEPSHFVFDPRLKPHLAWNARKKAVFAHTHTYCPAKLVNIGFFHLKFLTWLEVRPPQHFFVPFPLILCHYFCHPRWLLREKTVY